MGHLFFGRFYPYGPLADFHKQNKSYNININLKIKNLKVHHYPPPQSGMGAVTSIISSATDHIIRLSIDSGVIGLKT